MRQKGWIIQAAILPFLMTPAGRADPTCSGTGCTVDQDAIGWHPVMENDGFTSVSFFRYVSPDSATEIGPWDRYVRGWGIGLTTTVRPPHIYAFSDVATSSNGDGTYEYGTTAVTRGVCRVSNQWQNFGDYMIFPVYRGFGSFIGEFSGSRRERHISGLRFRGVFSGNLLEGLSPAGTALEVVFYSDSECTLGGHEYGFSKDLNATTVANWPGVINFYIADHANCYGGICNASDFNEARYATYSIPNIATNSAGWIEYFYAAYFVRDSHAPHGYIIRVQIVDPGTLTLVQCGNMVGNSNGAGFGTVTSAALPPALTGPCTFDITPPHWFRADLVNDSRGYLFNTIDAAGNPNHVGNSPALGVVSLEVNR
jgi:hypothetical protein